VTWVDQYIGVPFLKDGRATAGWDCWGCVRYVLALHAQIYLPSDPEKLDRSRWSLVEKARAFDLVEMPGLLVADGRTSVGRVHVGVFVNEKQVLHCQELRDTVCVPVDRLRLALRGIWRHESLR
jgi:cell wall-associated NlpC family hydrolase